MENEKRNEEMPEADAPGSAAPETGGFDTGSEPSSAWEDSALADGADAERLAALEAEIAELKGQHLRDLAEMENVRRRARQDREDASKFGSSNMARDLLTVADNLRRALDAVPADARENDPAVGSLIQGVELVERELLRAFEKHGIQRVEPAAGERFDHNVHQAMFELENTGHPPGTVVQVMQPGYVMHGRLLRAAMVGVAKGAPGNGQGEHVDTRA